MKPVMGQMSLYPRMLADRNMDKLIIQRVRNIAVWKIDLKKPSFGVLTGFVRNRLRRQPRGRRIE